MDGGYAEYVAAYERHVVKVPDAMDSLDAAPRGINIKGSIVGTHRDVEDVFKLHTLGLTRVLHETRPLEEVNEAFDDILHARNREPRVVPTV